MNPATQEPRPPVTAPRASAAVFDAPWPYASVCALACCCAFDLLAEARVPSLAFLAALSGLTLLIGLLHGAAWSLAFALLRALPSRAAIGSWYVASALAHVWLAAELGGWSRLNSRYALLAIGVLAACAVSSVVLGSSGAVLQPTTARPAGALSGWSLGVRRFWIAGWALAAAAMWVVDRRLFPGQYPFAHAALRLGALWMLMFAVTSALPRLPKVSGLGWAVALGAFAACLALLDERSVSTLDAFRASPWAASVLAVNRSLVDFDRDGQASVLGETDCAPWDARVHSGAFDVPGNGIDENCQLGDARGSSEPVQLVPASDEPASLDIVLITLDAANPMHMGLYNPAYGPVGRDTTPNLDRWAEGATVFERAYSPGGWTSVAVPALLRGVYARKLSWSKYFETNRFAMVAPGAQLRSGERAERMFPLAFADQHPSLPEMLRRRGFTTYAVVDDGFSALLESGTGIERGFDHYLAVDHLPKAQRNDAGTAQLALDVLANAPGERRLFLWVHFFGVHWPVEMHAGVRDYGSTPVDGYDHELAYLDTQLIRLLDALAERPQPTAVFITADHGENFNALTAHHGHTLDEPVIRIPLLARVPGWDAGRVAELASSIDLVPTILSLVGSPVPSYLDGVDLGMARRALEGRRLLSDTWRFDGSERVVGDYAAVYDGSTKLTIDRRTGSFYLAEQSDPSVKVGRLVNPAAGDPFAATLRTYLEEAGGLRFSN